ncbi:hypothetical protein ACH5RR_011159 [Cinchona calisaya]|uniref:Homeobox-leucine zipper protein n=1 Tax=Cinchona calisaya TaxID=153742 RepID=A0ABD3A9V9_9GENT
MIQSDMEAFFGSGSMFQDHEDDRLPSLNPSDDLFHGVSDGALMRRSMSFSGVDMSEEVHHHQQDDQEMSDDSAGGGAAPLGEKKKRLNSEQVKALEKSFEMGNKLEPERKMQLARSLGMQPRQVGIWFQNRRARWKNKQLEKDFKVLKRQLEVLESDNQLLRAQNKKFHSELLALKEKASSGRGGPINVNKENEASWSNGSENSIDVNLGTTSVESGLNSNSQPPINSHHVFPSTIGQPCPIFQQGSRRQDFQAPRNIDQTTSDEGLCNMFNTVDQEQPSFWPWPQQQNFH